jgi:hypothetical protein
MNVSRTRLSGLARALAASAVIGLAGLAATPALAKLTAAEAADANTLAELIVTATLQANATPDNPQTASDETRSAIQDAVETAIEGFQNGQAPPEVVSEAIWLAKAKLVQGAKWCPGSLSSTKSAVKSRAGPEQERGCAMSEAFAAIATTVQAAQDSAPSAIGGGPSAIPPASGLSGGGGGVTHPGAQ